MSPSPIPFFFLLLLTLPFSSAVPLQDHEHDTISRPLPHQWYQPRDHPIHNLFRRAPISDGYAYPAVGSPEWRSGFPTGVPDVTQLPQPWVDALNAAIAAGKIPNIPRSSNTPGTDPVYPGGLNPGGPEVCSSSYRCRTPTDIWDAPTGVLGIGFDDGPYPVSAQLYSFLQDQHEHATHFMIGVNILANPTQFTFAFETLEDDIAVHSYTHPYMTTLDNLSILGQLGWSMQLIHNSTGGRVPKYWRPPYGDSDNRVRAIAKEVFGMDSIHWNQDTSDWSIGQTGGAMPETINRNFQQWLSGPKTPGLIILEHEISPVQIQIFMNAYPIMKANGWNLVSVSRLGPTGSPYRNANGTTSPVSSEGVLVPDPATSTSTTSSSTTSTLPIATPSSTRINRVNGAMAGTTPRWGFLAGCLLFAGVGLMS